MANRIRNAHAMLAQEPQSLGVIGTSRGNHTAFACRNHLSRMEAEANEVAVTADFSTSIATADRTGRVFNDCQAMCFRQDGEAIHVSRQPDLVNYQDGLGAWCDF